MYILGISAFYHDSAAAILRDGEIIAAAQEERFTRRKHDLSFPAKAMEYKPSAITRVSKWHGRGGQSTPELLARMHFRSVEANYTAIYQNGTDEALL